MKEREQKELKKLLRDFYENLGCYGNCRDCGYGVLRGYGDSWFCPLDLVEDMVINKFENSELWEELHG